ALLLWLGTMGAAIFFLKLRSVSRQFNLSFFTLSACLIVLRQFIERALISYRANRAGNLRSAIIIGPQNEAEWLLNILSAKPEWYGTIARADLELVQAILAGAINSEPDRNNETMQSAEIFLLPGSEKESIVEEWALRLLKQGRTVHVIPALLDAHLFRQNLGDIAGVPTVTLEALNPTEMEAAMKRAVDVIAGSLLLSLLLPVMLVTALLIKITSKGPILFEQQRLGKGGKPFRIVKFRTMRADAEEILKNDPRLYQKYVDNNFKLPDGEDIRVTRLGRILRATSLDELPQLINVIRGEMSLVGPRPIVPDELQKYGDYASLLLMLKPGMTGNWQVSGRSTIAEYSDRVNLDMEYVRDQSFAQDLRILIRTVGAVARMDGAH
ncbi:MAG: sugar transferase, partial [Candidatus Binataceae bacterium]